MPEPTNEQIRIALAEVIVGRPTSVNPYYFDPFTTAADCDALEAWAWSQGVRIVADPKSTQDDENDEVTVEIYGEYFIEPITVHHDGTGPDMIRAKREAICRAIHAAVTKEVGDE